MMAQRSVKCAVMAQQNRQKSACCDGAEDKIGRSLSKSMKVTTRKMVCRDGADEESTGDQARAAMAQTTEAGEAGALMVQTSPSASELSGVSRSGLEAQQEREREREAMP